MIGTMGKDMIIWRYDCDKGP